MCNEKLLNTHQQVIGNSHVAILNFLHALPGEILQSKGEKLNKDIEIYMSWIVTKWQYWY